MNWPVPIAEGIRAAGASLEVHLLGMVDFDSALFLQERLIDEISGRDDCQGAVIVCEHSPLVTVGREGSRADLRAEPREFAARLMPVRWINRGGGVLVHAPGQLAVYPIIPLERLRLGLAAYRQALEQAAIDAAEDLFISAFSRPEAPGAWCRLGQFAFVGAAVRSWISYHGLFINVSPRLDLQKLVRSNAAGRATSLSVQRDRPLAMHSVREGVVRHVARRLGYERFHVYTGHRLLKRRRQKVYIGA